MRVLYECGFPRFMEKRHSYSHRFSHVAAPEKLANPVQRRKGEERQKRERHEIVSRRLEEGLKGWRIELEFSKVKIETERREEVYIFLPYTWTLGSPEHKKEIRVDSKPRTMTGLIQTRGRVIANKIIWSGGRNK